MVGLESTSAEGRPTLITATKSQKAGCILFMDLKLVVFNTKTLTKAPSSDALDGVDREALECVHSCMVLQTCIDGLN